MMETQINSKLVFTGWKTTVSRHAALPLTLKAMMDAKDPLRDCLSNRFPGIFTIWALEKIFNVRDKGEDGIETTDPTLLKLDH